MNESLATLLWRARKNAGLTVAEAADAAKLHINAIYRAEQHGRISLLSLQRLARVYGVKVVIALEEETPQ